MLFLRGCDHFLSSAQGVRGEARVLLSPLGDWEVERMEDPCVRTGRDVSTKRPRTRHGRVPTRRTALCMSIAERHLCITKAGDLCITKSGTSVLPSPAPLYYQVRHLCITKVGISVLPRPAPLYYQGLSNSLFGPAVGPAVSPAVSPVDCELVSLGPPCLRACKPIRLFLLRLGSR